MSDIQLMLDNRNGKVQFPILADDITWKTERRGVPGQLTFTVIKDKNLTFNEGDTVTLTVDGVKIFYGFVFTKSRDKQQHIKITAYDQLRYLKNKDVITYKDYTCADLIRKIASEYYLNVGELADTGLKVSGDPDENGEPTYMIHDGDTLFDVIQTNLDQVVIEKQKMYVLYDDFGKLTLKDIESMGVPYLIDKDTIENFDYSTTIDDNVYNKIKITYENKDEAVREVYIAQDSKNISQWGLLQYYESINNSSLAKDKVDALIELYDRRARKLIVKGAIGDLRIRAGCYVPVNLNLGDIIAKQYLIVETVTHKWSKGHHTMDMNLIGGGGFIA